MGKKAITSDHLGTEGRFVLPMYLYFVWVGNLCLNSIFMDCLGFVSASAAQANQCEVVKRFVLPYNRDQSPPSLPPPPLKAKEGGATGTGQMQISGITLVFSGCVSGHNGGAKQTSCFTAKKIQVA